jgi:regulator of sigma E protease
MTIVVALVGIAFLVFIHELGHFLTALAVGIRPRSFYVGFPPALVKTTRNGIEYAIGSIPLGGLVRIPGMHRPAAGDLEAAFGPALREAPELAPRVHALARDLEAEDFQAVRAEVAVLQAATAEGQLSTVARKTAERALRDLDEGSGSDAYWRQPTWRRIAVILAGPLVNIVFAVVIFTAAFMLPSDAYRLGFVLKARGQAATSTVDSVLAGHPARAMGLRAGDRIVAVDGKPVSGPQIAKRIQASKGRPVSLTVERAGGAVRLGPARPSHEAGEPFPTAVRDSFSVTGRVIGGTLGFLAHIPQRHKEVSSSVGIVRESSRAAKEGLQAYLGILGFISLSLGILNLLPLLPLDGGHILFSLIERVRGRAVRREVYERVSMIGIAAVLLLMVIGLSNDLGGGAGPG